MKLKKQGKIKEKENEMKKMKLLHHLSDII